jgi:hypothetical protein
MKTPIGIDKTEINFLNLAQFFVVVKVVLISNDDHRVTIVICSLKRTPRQSETATPQEGNFAHCLSV